MRGKIVSAIFRKELRDILRDRRTLAMMVLLPLVLFPLLVGLMAGVFNYIANRDISDYNRIGIGFECNETLGAIMDAAQIERVEESSDGFEKMLDEGKINAFILKSDKTYTVCYSESDFTSISAYSLAAGALGSYKEIIQRSVLKTESIEPDIILNAITIETKNVSGANGYAAQLAAMLPAFVLMAITLAATYPAIDVTAGEKERGTLETLLTFPVRNSELITGKYLAVALSACVSAVLSFGATYGAFFIAQECLPIFDDGRVSLGAGGAALILAAFLLFAVFVSGLSIAVASNTKSFKEAQNAVTPLNFLTMVPIFLSMLGVKSSLLTSAIPYLNVAMISEDIVSKNLHIPQLIVMLGSTVALTALTVALVVKLYRSEKILFKA